MSEFRAAREARNEGAKHNKAGSPAGEAPEFDPKFVLSGTQGGTLRHNTSNNWELKSGADIPEVSHARKTD